MSELCIACNSPVEDRKYALTCDVCSHQTTIRLCCAFTDVNLLYNLTFHVNRLLDIRFT